LLCNADDKAEASIVAKKTLAVDFFIISQQQKVVGQTIFSQSTDVTSMTEFRQRGKQRKCIVLI